VADGATVARGEPLRGERVLQPSGGSR
jgi:hypothetical protein